MKAFEVNDKDYLDATEWKIQHSKTKHNGDFAEAGGRYTWCFTPSAFGTVIEVRCVCGSKIDLTRSVIW